MASVNTRKPRFLGTNNEDVPARRITPAQELRRSVMACMLWEDSFYEDGTSIADRIASLIPLVDAAKVAEIAIEAREQMKLRHVPLLLCRELARRRRLKAETLTRVIQRSDEIPEFLSIYWKDGRQPLAASVKRGLAAAFHKFDEHQLAKYDRGGGGRVRLRDALFLCHAKPKNAAQDAMWKRLIDGVLATPDTWEVALSAAKDKRAEWSRLLAEKKLGALALLRNLRNMTEAGVPLAAIRAGLSDMDAARVLPFRFIAAARAVPSLEDAIEPVMLRAMGEMRKLPGKTVLLVDTSPSMAKPISAKSDLSRMDAAFGLAVLCRELCEDVEICAFSSECTMVPPRRGFALADAIRTAVPSNGTLLGKAVAAVSGRYDRLVCITDEESQDAVPNPDAGKANYLINVATSKNGIGYGPWVHIDGWSEAVIGYIAENELARDAKGVAP
jgi:hypothetical protein